MGEKLGGSSPTASSSSSFYVGVHDLEAMSALDYAQNLLWLGALIKTKLPTVRVIWITLDDTCKRCGPDFSLWQNRRRQQPYLAAQRFVAAHHGWEVVDWHRVSWMQEEALHSDAVHGTPAAVSLMLKLVAMSVRSLQGG
jgi:hypothetical protein